MGTDTPRMNIGGQREKPRWFRSREEYIIRAVFKKQVPISSLILIINERLIEIIILLTLS